MTDVDRATYNPIGPAFFADPYQQYARLRAENPIHVTKYGFIVLTRREHVVPAYRNAALSRNTKLWKDFPTWRRGVTDGPLERMMTNWLVMIDPPRHTPLRAIHEKVFTRRLFDAVGPAVDAIVADLLAPGVDAGGMDLVSGLADRAPVYLISQLLGLPRGDWDLLVEWSRAVALTNEPLLTTKVIAAGEAALQAMYDYFGPLVELRRTDVGDDALSGLAVTEVDGVRLTTGELLDSLVFLYQAGHPTSTHLMSLGVKSLLDHPDQLALLRGDPTLIPNAVEELHRFDGPVQMNDRVALEGIELFGREVHEGQLVRLCLASANRDGAHYRDADRLDVTRTVADQLGYGHGLHECVGARLGRLQARALLRLLLPAAPGLRHTGAKLRYLPSASNRGLTALPVEF
jgi:cytochrome P450